MLPDPAAPARQQFQQVLGVRFFDGTPDDAVACLMRSGGYIVVPAAPAMVKLHYDADFRRALVEADLAIADSGLMVLLWRFLQRRRLTRVSGLAYLKALLKTPGIQERGKTLWVVPTTAAVGSAKKWLAGSGLAVTDESFYVAPFYGARVCDQKLAAKIESLHPAHVVIAIGGGPQEKLGLFLRENVGYRPAIHCIGAALGFLTGDQIAIPNWADRFYLGWLFRLFAQPRIFIPRLWSAHKLPGMIARYGASLPPLKTVESGSAPR